MGPDPALLRSHGQRFAVRAHVLFAHGVDAVLQSCGLCVDVVVIEQALGQGQQQAIARCIEAPREERLQVSFFPPERAEHHKPFRCCLAHPCENAGVTGADFQQQLIRRSPALTFPYNL